MATRAASLLVVLLAVASVPDLAAPAAPLAGMMTKGGGGDLGELMAGAATIVMRRGSGGRRTCRGGTVGDCMEEDFLDAEAEGDVAGMATGGSHRRVLQSGSGYIGYDALRRDSVPCSQRGASYYNCQPGGEANPYSRGCSAIAQCRS